MQTLNEISAIIRVELRASVVTLRPDGIIHCDIKPVDEYMVNDVHEVLNFVKMVGNDKKFPNLITIKQYVTFHKEARALAASEEGNRYTIADAIVFNSTALMLVMNLYLAFDKPVRPTRHFKTEERAVEWLKTFY